MNRFPHDELTHRYPRTTGEAFGFDDPIGGPPDHIGSVIKLLTGVAMAMAVACAVADALGWI